MIDFFSQDLDIDMIEFSEGIPFDSSIDIIELLDNDCCSVKDLERICDSIESRDGIIVNEVR